MSRPLFLALSLFAASTGCGADEPTSTTPGAGSGVTVPAPAPPADGATPPPGTEAAEPAPREDWMPDKLGKVGEGTAADKAGRAPLGEPMPVTIKFTAPATAKAGALAFLGVAAADVRGSWMAGGVEPQFFWESASVPYGAEITLDGPLARELTYFVVINQDDNLLPGPEDLVAGPLLVAEGAKGATFEADRHFSFGP